MTIELTGRVVPRGAMVFSVACLLVPVVAFLVVPARLGEASTLLWLLALVPAFTMAYYRAARGIATALAVGMATIIVTEAAAVMLQRQAPESLPAVLVAYVAIAFGIGWLAEALHQDRAEVEDMAFTDLLTKLPNRRHARLFLENEFAAAERGRTLSIVLFDLDRFKSFNDRYGHAAGDAALTAFGEILGGMTRRMDLSGRFGGEEFISVLTATDTEGALIFADRIRQALQTSEIPGAASLTVSGGVATYHATFRSPDELLAAADQALYQAKNDGRNRIRLFERSYLDEAQPDHPVPPDVLAGAGGLLPRYPRETGELGRSSPSLDLLPHQVTGFGKGRRVLIVEDDHQVRSLIGDYLEAEGFETAFAVDVSTGIAALDDEFDAVVTDVRLPGLSGTEMVRAVKSRWPSTQVLVITGAHDATVAGIALSAGADAYLVKPFGMPDLRRYLVDALNRRDRSVHFTGDLDEAARERAQAARRAVLEGATSLVRAAEARDPYMFRHGENVSRYTSLLADALDPDQVELNRAALELGCRLHDVGKVGLSDRLLNKAGRLERHERALMERHPTIGRSLLEPLLDDDLALSVVTWHHERWDGRGYPDGLAGETIPLAARLVSVTDTLDAMTCDRAHRPAHPWDRALGQIRSGEGTSHDPRVIGAFEACLPALEGLYHELRATS